MRVYLIVVFSVVIIDVKLTLIKPVAQMLMPKKNRIAIYELLFKEGVMVAKKDVHLAKHPELADKNVPNLHVMKAMQVRNWRGESQTRFHCVVTDYANLNLPM